MQQNCPDYGDSCSAVIQQAVDVALPISLVPLIDLGNIKIMCNGEPRVECCNCAGGNGGLELKITQTITYKIPIAYRIEANTGDVTSECKKSISSTNCGQCHY